MAKRELVLESEAAAIHAHHASRHRDLGQIDDVADAIVRRLAHKQLPIEHPAADAVEESALRGRVGAVLGYPIIDRAAGEIKIDVCAAQVAWRSEEHTSELQSLRHLVC